MALPTKSDLLSLDYTLIGSPYVEVTAGGSSDTSLDYSLNGSPFVVLATSGGGSGAVKEANADLSSAFSQTVIGSEIADANSNLSSTSTLTATISHIEGADITVDGFASITVDGIKIRFGNATLESSITLSADVERIPAGVGETKEFEAALSFTISQESSAGLIAGGQSDQSFTASITATLSYIFGVDIIASGFATVTAQAQRISIVDGLFAAESSLSGSATLISEIVVAISSSANVSTVAERIIRISSTISNDFNQSTEANLISDNSSLLTNQFTVESIAVKTVNAEMIANCEFTQAVTLSHIEGADLFAMTEAALATIVSRLRDNNSDLSEVFDIATDYVRLRTTNSDEAAVSTVSADVGRNRDYTSEIAVAFSFACDFEIAIFAQADISATAAVTADANRTRRSASTQGSTATVSSTGTRIKQFNTLGFTPRTQRSLTVNGNTAVTTAQKKVGTGSIAFDGSGDNIVVTSDPVFDFTTDHTVEFWWRRNNNTAQHTLVDFRSGTATNNLRLYVNTLPYLYIWYDNGIAGNNVTPFSPSSGTWVHTAVTFKRNSATNWDIVMYVDGVNKFSRTNVVVDLNQAALTIGSTYTGTEYLNGQIDELRVSNSLRYTGNFTPTTTAYNNDANTVFLLHGDSTIVDDIGPDPYVAPGLQSAFTQITDAKLAVTVQLEGTLFATADLTVDIDVIYGGVASAQANADLSATISHIEGADIIASGFATMSVSGGIVYNRQIGIINNFIVTVVNPQYYRGFNVNQTATSDIFAQPTGYRVFDSAMSADTTQTADNLILRLADSQLSTTTEQAAQGDRFRLGVIDAQTVSSLSVEAMIPVYGTSDLNSEFTVVAETGFLQLQQANLSSEFTQSATALGFRVFDASADATTALQAAITNVRGIDVVIFDFATMSVNITEQKRAVIDAVVDTAFSGTILKTTQGNADIAANSDLAIEYRRWRTASSELSSEFTENMLAEIRKVFDSQFASTTALTLDTVQAYRYATVNTLAEATVSATAQTLSDNDIDFAVNSDINTVNNRIRGIDASLTVDSNQNIVYLRQRDESADINSIATQNTFAVKTVEAIIVPLVMFDTGVYANATKNQDSIMVANTAMSVTASTTKVTAVALTNTANISVNEIILRGFDSQTFMEFNSSANAAKIVIGSGSLRPSNVPGEPPIVEPDVFASQFTLSIIANKITYKQFDSNLSMALSVSATALRTLQYAAEVDSNAEVSADQIRIREVTLSIDSAFSPSLYAGAVRNDELVAHVDTALVAVGNKIVFVGGPGLGGNSVVGNAIIESDLLNFASETQQAASLAKMLRSRSDLTAFYSELSVVEKKTDISANFTVSSTLVAGGEVIRGIESHLGSTASLTAKANKIEAIKATLTSQFAVTVDIRALHILEYVYVIPGEGRAFTITSETRVRDILSETRTFNIRR